MERHFLIKIKSLVEGVQSIGLHITQAYRDDLYSSQCSLERRVQLPHEEKGTPHIQLGAITFIFANCMYGL
jgi:hypothetical protein